MTIANAAPDEGYQPQAIRKAVDAGYLVGVHHNHSWIQGRWIEDDPSLRMRASSAPTESLPTHNPWDPRGRLDRCPAAHLEVFLKHARAEREMGVNYFFTDCTTTGGAIEECYLQNIRSHEQKARGS